MGTKVVRPISGTAGLTPNAKSISSRPPQELITPNLWVGDSSVPEKGPRSSGSNGDDIHYRVQPYIRGFSIFKKWQKNPLHH
jgi:hypothetical protein